MVSWTRFLALLLAAGVLTGCPFIEECRDDSDCTNGQVCLRQSYGLGGVASVCGVRTALSDTTSDVQVCEADTETDPENCSACGVVCRDQILGEHLAVSCENAMCVAGACDSGYQTLTVPGSDAFRELGCQIAFDPNDADVVTLPGDQNVVGVVRGAQTTVVADLDATSLILRPVPDTSGAQRPPLGIDGISGARVSGAHVGVLGRGLLAVAAESGTSSVYVFDSEGVIESLDELSANSVASTDPHHAVDVSTILSGPSGSAADIFFHANDTISWITYYRVGDSVPYSGASCAMLSNALASVQRCEVAQVNVPDVTSMRLVSLGEGQYYLIYATHDAAGADMGEFKLDLTDGSLSPSTTLVPDDNPSEEVIDIAPWREQVGDAHAKGIVVLGRQGEASFMSLNLGPQVLEGRTLEKSFFPASGVSSSPNSVIEWDEDGTFLILGDDGLFLIGADLRQTEPLENSNRVLWRYGAIHAGLRVLVRESQLLRYPLP